MSSNKKATTLFNLKDEYLKAKQEVHNANLVPTSNKKIKDIIQFKKEEKVKKTTEKSSKQRRRDARLALTEQEEQDLAKSKSKLEAKSAVYEKLLNKAGEECSENILVDFSQKRSEEVNTDTSSALGSGGTPLPEEVRGDDEVHFANVDHGEVRSKGVGFYTFSEDPVTRKQQMEFLNSMRETTERSRELFLAGKRKKREEKLGRINRLRGRLGMESLVFLPGESEEQVVEPDEEDGHVTTEGQGGNDGVTDSNDAHSKTVERVPNITAGRGLIPGKSIEEQFLQREQSLWEKRVEELRNEREMEFAPYYQTDNVTHSHIRNNASHSRGNNEDSSMRQDDIDEESSEIVNFISFVRRNT